MEQGPYLPVVDRSAAPLPEPEQRELPFRFTGKASEYFRIWIVNTLLTVVTLGIYSAWAKIRNKQYFYRNTWLDGSSFDYLAKPIPILKGRIIAAVALGLLFATQKYSPKLYLLLLLVYVLFSPWVVVKALAFNARNSAYRNIRFAFVGRTGEAFGVYLGMMLFYMATCGLGLPYAEWRLTGFVVKRHLFGDLEFGWNSKSGSYYRVYLAALAVSLPVYLVLFGILVSSAHAGGENAQKEMAKAIVPVMVVFYAYSLVPAALIRARVANLLYGGMHIGPHRLSSNQRWGELLKLYAVNIVAIVLSLGLLIPWAKIRLAAYRASHLTFHAVGELSAETLFNDEAGAVGEGISDLGDFDIGIGT
jgi:uncharacterized membrane protein YjgN (DUF898 family)